MGYRASAAFPLLVTGEVYGTLNLYSHQSDSFDADELKLLDEMAANIAFALEFIEEEEQRRRAEEELKRYSKELEEANTAMRVFMNRRDRDQKILQEKLQMNTQELVFPYLKKLKGTKLDSLQQNYLSVLEGNLNTIVSPYLLNLSATYKNLTPQEIQIANLIRLGKNTKEIAELLGASPHTIGTHRNNIRKKLQLRNSKANLRSLLLSLP